MERMLVAVFDNEAKANEGSAALQRLGEDGEIAVHTVRIFARDKDGTVTSDEISDALP
jgi:hypothetical protein